MNNEDDNEIPVEGEKVDVDLNDVVNHIGSTLFDDGKNEQEENNQETPNDNNAPDQDDSKRSSSSSSDSSDFSEEKEKENIEAEKSENIEGKNQNDENDEGKLENTINQNVNSLLDGQNENTDQSPENANEIEKTDENQQNNNSAGINRDLQQNDVAPSSENIQNEQSKAPFETDVQENTAIPQPNPDNQEYYSTSYSSSYYEEEEINETMHIPQLDPISRQNPNQKNAMRKDDDDDGVPPGLKPLIYHAKDSLTYQALRNEQIHGLTQTALTSIVNDLRKYVDMAVDHNLINEACHVQMCIDTIRNDHSAEKMQVDRELTDIEKRLQEANLELEERLNLYVYFDYYSSFIPELIIHFLYLIGIN
ncbi:hypothetical protein TRFO_15944 [Tritrichomonas foetus]|uniref:Uncharacterized protein n=1 Tax=Tritrichomonas foetus TaxID=1144522 RepID=A0A1J4KVU7_9EUKA|nr:hypothetical protein TRFO_15944 [Tritrichomonas foetus]|eukprot:OHT13822.1 hypothetical protein TRFO_15944 [Tritrichomonas foetus]